MNRDEGRLLARVGLLTLGCLSTSFHEVARDFGSWLPHRPRLAIDDRALFPQVTGRDESGAPLTTRPVLGEPALVFIVSPFCSVCDQNAPNLRRLLEVVYPAEASPLPVDVLFVSMAPTDLSREFLSRHGLRGRLVAVNEAVPASQFEARTAEQFDSTPQAFLLDAQGRVLLKSGVLDDADVTQWTEVLWASLEAK